MWGLPVAETSTRHHTTLNKTDIAAPRRDLNLQSQQASGRSPTPWTARPPGWTKLVVHGHMLLYIRLQLGGNKEIIKRLEIMASFKCDEISVRKQNTMLVADTEGGT